MSDLVRNSQESFSCDEAHYSYVLYEPHHEKTCFFLLHKSRERGGSVVEYGLWSERTGARNLPTSASCILEQDTFLPKSTGNTQKVGALS